MTDIVWIVGHGLLGSELESQVRTKPEIQIFHAPAFSWNDAEKLASEFSHEIRAFGEVVQKKGGHYHIFWTAGRGIMSSNETGMRCETDTLALFLHILDAESHLKNVLGTLCFASSAGAVYAGSMDDVISETTPTAPTTAYGHGKLEQEALMKSCANPQRGIMIARMSNLYGPGQSRTKKQGLLTHIARCMLTRTPIHMYVPFDTIRDYLHVSDAATDLMNASAFVKPGEVVTKIIASEEPTTIATIIGLFHRITRQNPLVVTGTNQLGAVYPHRMRFSSIVLKNARQTKRVSLPEGIAETMAYERLQYAKSGMPNHQ